VTDQIPGEFGLRVVIFTFAMTHPVSPYAFYVYYLTFSMWILQD